MQTHLKGYVTDYDKLTKAGAEIIVCVAVNDAFVMEAWGDASGAKGKVCHAHFSHTWCLQYQSDHISSFAWPEETL